MAIWNGKILAADFFQQDNCNPLKQVYNRLRPCNNMLIAERCNFKNSKITDC